MIDEFKRNDGQDTISIEMKLRPSSIRGYLKFIQGVKIGKGKSQSMQSALARPYKQLFDEGKPIGKINYIFFIVNKWPSHVLGSLCFTPGQQLLFFPGLIERKVNWYYSKQQTRQIDIQC